MQAGRRLSLVLIFFGSLLLAGCKNRELVENELRARDIQYREALDVLGGFAALPGRGLHSRPPEAMPRDTAPVIVPALKQTYPNIPVGVWFVPPLPTAVELGRPVPHVPEAVGLMDE